MARSLDLSVRPTILTVPGLGGSGPSHWQTLWERHRPDVARVELGMWDRPHRNAWVTKLDQAVAAARAPVILVAHSLGCIAVAWWASLSPQPYGWPVAGALLVAPADVDFPERLPVNLLDFAPTPLGHFPFPTTLVASTNDPFMAFARAKELANCWGSTLVNLRDSGHINVDSGFGRWPHGEALLDDLLNSVNARLSAVSSFNDEQPRHARG